VKRPRSSDRPEPARPLCACGQPGAFQVMIDVQELVLNRDAGMSARPYWTASYRTGTKIEAIMCQRCVAANVRLSVSATATVEHGSEVP